MGTIVGTSGNDNLYSPGSDYIYALDGADIIWANSGSDRVYASFGDDIIFINSGSGSIDGGADSDWLSFYYAWDPVTVNLSTGTAHSPSLSLSFYSIEKISGSTFSDVIRGGVRRDVLYGWEGSGSLYGNDGKDRLYGGDDNDALYGGAGNDYLNGGNGGDWLYGGPGNDVINGGNGTDRVLYTDATSSMSVTLMGGRATGSGRSDTLSSIEDITGAKFNDILWSSNTANDIWGWNGNDDIYGFGGNDALKGGVGNDRINGGGGNNLIMGGLGIDQLWGSFQSDKFVFDRNDKGNVFAGQADVINDFSDIDLLSIPLGLSYVAGDWTPADGEYSVLDYGDDHVVRWNLDNAYHDVLVIGDDPAGNILTDYGLI